MIDADLFRIPDGAAVDLTELPTKVTKLYDSKKEYKTLLRSKSTQMRELQARLYADDKYSLLLVFQAMDAAGKDGAIKHVMSGINPQGCQVHSFKQPSKEELDHDFLWRTSRRLPERGRIGIFNRSYYEEVLVVRVHPEYLSGQRLGPLPEDLDDLWRARFRSITDHERHLHLNGTRVVKFYLHLSEAEQRQRFLARLDDPEKNWKFNAGDVTERRFWPEYRQAYSEAIAATSTAESPWYVVPADDKKNARLIISDVVVNTLGKLDTSFPEPSDKEREEMQRYRAELEAQGPS